MLRRGIYLAPSQFEAAFLSAAHTEEDIRRTAAAARDVLPRCEGRRPGARRRTLRRGMRRHVGGMAYEAGPVAHLARPQRSLTRGGMPFTPTGRQHAICAIPRRGRPRSGRHSFEIGRCAGTRLRRAADSSFSTLAVTESSHAEIVTT